MPSTAEQIERINEQIEERTDEAQAIVQLAIDENRENTPEELERFHAIMGPADALGTAGEIFDLETQRNRVEAIHNRVSQRRQVTTEGRGIQATMARQATAGSDGAVATTRFALNANRPVIVPVRAQVHGRMTAFPNTPEGEAEAYATGQFLLATGYSNERARQWCREHGIEIRLAQEIGDDSLGGYLTPEPMERGIMTLTEQFGVIRRDARRWNMTGKTLEVPKTLTHLEAHPIGELASMSGQDVTVENPTITARKWYVMSEISSELTEDAVIDMANYWTTDAARAFAYKEDLSGFFGDGTATYNSITGIRDTLAAGSTYTSTGVTTFATLTIANFTGMVGLVPNYAGINPVWYAHKTAWAASMLDLAADAGGNNFQTFERGAMMQSGGYDFMFLGYPGRWLNVGVKTADEGTGVEGGVFLGDLSLGVSFGVRRGVAVAADASTGFKTDSTWLRGTTRWGINVHEAGTATAAGAVVMLKFG